MRCVRCGVNTQYRARTAGKGCECGEAFAFEPKYKDPLADRAFGTAIERVSAGGTLKWLPVHLHYEVCRRIYRRRWFKRREVPIDRPAFDSLWERWKAAHGLPPTAIDGVLEPMGLAAGVYPDVLDYAFDRAVITDSDATLQMLLANNFHVDNRCAVLSIDRQPSAAFDTVLSMVRQSPGLQVLAVHDASAAGSAMAGRLVFDDEWFHHQVRDGTATVVDLGLRPDQTKPFKGCFLRSDARSADLTVSKTDRTWLSRYRLELAAVPPLSLVRLLQRAFFQPGQSGDADFVGGDDGFG